MQTGIASLKTAPVATARSQPFQPAGQAERYGHAAELLGAAHSLHDAVDVHEALLHGLPGSALKTLVDGFVVLPKSGKRLEAALGVSLRTMQRKNGHAARLTVEQAGRTWQFAEILARASAVLGSQEAAERWLEHPALALDRRCPIDLLATPAGTRMVEDHLTRMEYGVYT